jgi:hypothetical protein
MATHVDAVNLGLDAIRESREVTLGAGGGRDDGGCECRSSNLREERWQCGGHDQVQARRGGEVTAEEEQERRSDSRFAVRL